MQSPGITIIRKSTLAATPWKNGGGITREVLRVPSVGDPFQWRVSVAQIDAPGPFSDFAGYTRIMVLLRGRGLCLRFAHGEEKELSAIGDLVQFDGAASVMCELLDGPCVDLNLMTSKTMRVNAQVDRSTESVEVVAAEGETALIFGIDGMLRLEDCAGGTQSLEPWDACVLTRSRVRVSRTGLDLAPPAALLAVVKPSFDGETVCRKSV